jgi:hypothetical protein
MADHHQLSNFIWQVADLLRGPYRPPQYGRVMLPLTVLDQSLNRIAGQRFHNPPNLALKEQMMGQGSVKVD